MLPFVTCVILLVNLILTEVIFFFNKMEIQCYLQNKSALRQHFSAPPIERKVYLIKSAFVC